ncbi:MAG: Uma2 family endonuclease [Verrucomicrobia bacterium]|nr:Uma2 family endonuclease [Verrucomicrobiota bacterium]
MSSAASLPSVSTEKTKSIPLHAGDHLSASEFLRRYRNAGENVEAELINGVVYIMLPAHFEAHGKPESIIHTWLGHYATFTLTVEHASGSSVKISRIDVPQPDSLLFVKPEAGGGCRITEDDYLEGAPEFVAEVSASSASYDCREKLEAYLRAGVREYLIWRTYDGAVDWFVLKEDEFVRLEPDSNSVLRSPFLPGLWLNTKALLAHDRRGVLQTLDEGIQSRDLPSRP